MRDIPLNNVIKTLFLYFVCMAPALASEEVGRIDLTNTVAGFTALVLFSIAYILVIGEEFMHLRKSKPVLVAAGIIWFIIGWVYTQQGSP